MSSRPSAAPAPRPVADALVGRTLASDVLHRLRADLVAARLHPGAPLRFEALRGQYGASFGTLREALAHLVTEGLVVAEGQRGFRVAPASRAGVADLIEVQTLVERRALLLSIRAGGAGWEDGVRAALAALEAAREAGGPDYHLTPDWVRRHREFHAALAAACGSPTLLEIRALLHERWQRYRSVLLRGGAPLPRTTDTHAALAQAALARDAERAMDLMEGQIRESLAILLARAGHVLPEAG